MIIVTKSTIIIRKLQLQNKLRKKEYSQFFENLVSVKHLKTIKDNDFKAQDKEENER